MQSVKGLMFKNQGITRNGEERRLRLEKTNRSNVCTAILSPYSSANDQSFQVLFFESIVLPRGKAIEIITIFSSE